MSTMSGRRRPIVAGNWKMNTNLEEARALALELRSVIADLKPVDCVLCPPFISLAAVRDVVSGSDIQIGAQDMHWDSKGAFTGEISASMLATLCQYVIIGHSERRQYFGETDETVNRKVRAAIVNGLHPIVCVGENLAQNERGETLDFVSQQVRAALKDIEPTDRLVIAYEPIWAIGTGRAATAADANRVIGAIRGFVDEAWTGLATRIRIQYGGSVTAASAVELFAQPEIDGALVGGASLKASEFATIVTAAAAAA